MINKPRLIETLSWKFRRVQENYENPRWSEIVWRWYNTATLNCGANEIENWQKIQINIYDKKKMIITKNIVGQVERHSLNGLIIKKYEQIVHTKMEKKSKETYRKLLS